jgi:hypothetical protein
MAVVPQIGPHEFVGWLGSLQFAANQGGRIAKIQTSAFAPSWPEAWLLTTQYAALVSPTAGWFVRSQGGAEFDGIKVAGLTITKVRKVRNRRGEYQVDAEWELMA